MSTVNAPPVGHGVAQVSKQGEGVGPKIVRGLALLVLSLLAWQLAATIIDNQVLPGLPEFATAASQAVTTPTYWAAIGQTLLGWALGLAAATIIGVPLGLLIGNIPILDRSTRITIDVFRSLPLIVVTPILVLNFGTTLFTKSLLVFLATLWFMILHASYGAKEVDRVAKETAASYHLTRAQKFRFLYVPSAAGFIATGLRISAIVALGVCIGVELITSVPGLGLEILRSSSNARHALAFFYFITASVVGLGITQLFQQVEHAALFWHPKFR